MKIQNLTNLNTETLAYMGDAVYELFIREMLLASGMVKVNNIHKAATKYVNASAQAKAIRFLMDSEELSEYEQRLVKRARNHKYNSKAKNVNAVTYKWATAFEAFAGYLYLAEDEKRLTWLMKRAVDIVDEKNKGKR